MTTHEAFKFLVHSPYLWLKTGKTKNTRRLYKHRVLRENWPTIETMEELLNAVFVVKQEKIWEIK